MNPARLALLALLGLTVPSVCRGEQEPKALYSATLVADTEVKAGASNSDNLYATNRLRKGDIVEVVKELEGGWLGIKPPPGSFSWINMRFVQQIPQARGMWMVVAHPEAEVPLLIGSTMTENKKPTVQGAKLKRGAQLRSIGNQQMAEDGYWLPVESPSTEVRYIRAEAVAKKPLETVAGASPPSPPGAEPGAAPPLGAHPLWVQAQKEEQSGKYAEAVQTYRRLGQETAQSDPNLSTQSLTRAQWLEDRLRMSGAAAGAKQPQAPAPAGMTTIGPGYLRRAGQGPSYNPVYHLEDSRGKILVSASPQPGYSLDSYVNAPLELIGIREYRADMRAFHMVVYQVRPMR